jgi:hypothetical protein
MYELWFVRGEDTPRIEGVRFLGYFASVKEALWEAHWDAQPGRYHVTDAGDESGEDLVAFEVAPAVGV